MKRLKFIAYILCLLPLLCACNNKDDVQQIFTGKTWKLTYITSKNGHSWYKFTGVSESVYQSYTSGTRQFQLSFSSNSSTDNSTSGIFSGSGSANISGNWIANGKDNSFLTEIKNSSIADSKDALASKIITGIKTANSYTGDVNNLFIYFDYKDSSMGSAETLCLAFTPV